MFRKCTAHLDEVHESYTEHMAFAMEISWLMISGAVLIFLHALIPGIFVRSGSQRINLMARKIRERQNDPTIQDFVI